MTARLVNASARNRTSRSRAWTSSISHAQKANGLVWGLSTRNTLTPQSTHLSIASSSACHSVAPVRRLPVDVVDVLVALGRVLGVLQGAVGPAVKPLRVLGQPRVVGASTASRSPARCRCRSPPRPPVSERRSSSVPSSAWMASWPPVASPIAHGEPGIAGGRGERVVAPLAVGEPDRVDRRQVDDVEAELGQLRAAAPRRPSGRPTSAGTSHTRRRSGPAAGRPRCVSG